MERDYILTYWWDEQAPSGGTWPVHQGVAVHRGTDVVTAAEALGREFAAIYADIVPDAYEILSAVTLSPKGPEVQALSLRVDGPNQVWNAHISPELQEGADHRLGSRGPNIYAITGTEAEGDLRFVQVLRARDLDQALLAVEDFLDKPGGEQVKFWSAVEMFPDRSANVWWFDAMTRTMASFDLVEQLKPSTWIHSAQALDAINRHRALMGMRPLDPVAAGWTEQDIRDEAQRIARLPNVAGHLMP